MVAAQSGMHIYQLTVIIMDKTHTIEVDGYVVIRNVVPVSRVQTARVSLNPMMEKWLKSSGSGKVYEQVLEVQESPKECQELCKMLIVSHLGIESKMPYR